MDEADDIPNTNLLRKRVNDWTSSVVFMNVFEYRCTY